MFLGQTMPYLRRRHLFTGADAWGASVAHHELVRAILKYQAAQGVHFFLECEFAADEMHAALDELNNDLPYSENECFPTARLGELARHNAYVFVEGAESLPGLAASRRHSRSQRFPITGLVHAVPTHGSFPYYLSLLTMMEKCDRIVATSHAGKVAFQKQVEGAIEFLKESATLYKTPEVNVIPLGVDTEELCPGDQGAARHYLGLPQKAKIILFLGRLSDSFKADLEPLLVSFKTVLRTDYGAPLLLVIAGKRSPDGYQDRMYRLACELGIEAQLRFHCDFPFKDKVLLYRAADIFVSPADNIQETFGLSVLEAMSCGLPVIASDWSGYRDLVINGDTGFLVPTLWCRSTASYLSPAAPISYRKSGSGLAANTVVQIGQLTKAIDELLWNSDLASKMGAAGRERAVRQFNWKRIVGLHRALWGEQLRDAKSMNVRFEPLIGYNEAFGHFGTSELEHSDIQSVKLTSERMLEHRKWSNQADCLMRDRLHCAARAIASGNQLSHNEVDWQAIAWLLKKGYAEINLDDKHLR